MTLNTKKMGGSKVDFGRVEDGTYPARLVQIIDLGVQPQTDWQTGEDKDPAPRAIFTFELPTERIEVKDEDKPRWYSKEYTLSMGKNAALPKLIKALSPKGDVDTLPDLLGKDCMISIGTTSGGKAKITGVTKTVVGMKVPDLENKPSAFDFSEPDVDIYKTFPEWIRNKIKEAVNYPGSELEELLNNNNNKEEEF